jgi:hypothetical protein
MLLAEALAGVYRVFAAYPLRARIAGCPHCVGEVDELALHTAPLGQLGEDDLGLYAFKAMSTFGDVEDFKHFLPRILELMLVGGGYPGLGRDVVGSKLALAKADGWPEGERRALGDFLLADWQACLDRSIEDEDAGGGGLGVEERLCLAANACADLGPFFDAVRADVSREHAIKVAAYADRVIHFLRTRGYPNTPGWPRGKHDAALSAWLFGPLREQLSSWLERADTPAAVWAALERLD